MKREGLNDLWGKLTPEEQKELSDELHKMFQEEIDKEIISTIRNNASKENEDG